MTWTGHVGSDLDWDAAVTQLGARSPFTLSGWGRTKMGGRWTIIRAMRTSANGVVAAVQVQYLRLPGGVVLAWIPGGVVGGGPSPTNGLVQWLKRATNARALYVRVAFHTPRTIDDELALQRDGWAPCASFIGARETFILMRVDGSLTNVDRLSANWRRNLQRGIDRNREATVWLNPDPAEVFTVSQEMISYKKFLGPQETADLESLQTLFTEMGKHLLVAQVRDEENRLLALRGAFVIGNHAWDAIAAAGVAARKSYSSYVCAWKLLTELDSQGIVYFDLAGVDEERNEGVFNFKKGFGGERTVYLGEWDWASSRLIRIGARTLLSRLK